MRQAFSLQWNFATMDPGLSPWAGIIQTFGLAVFASMQKSLGREVSSRSNRMTVGGRCLVRFGLRQRPRALGRIGLV